MSFCIKKDLVFSLRKSNNTKYYRTLNTCLYLVPYLLIPLLHKHRIAKTEKAITFLDSVVISSQRFLTSSKRTYQHH
jgi:hypothetical protein